MSLLGELIVKITGDASPLSQSVKKAEASMQAFDAKLKKTGTQVKEFGGRLTAVASAPILGLFITSLGKLKNSTDPAAKSLKDMDSVIGDFQIQIAKALIPVIEQVSGIIKGLSDWFKNLDDNTKQTIVQVGLLVAAIGPLLAILGTLASLGIPGLIGGIVALGAALAAVVINTEKTTEAQKKHSEEMASQKKRLGELAEANRKHFEDLEKEEEFFKKRTESYDDYLKRFRDHKISYTEVLALVQKDIEFYKNIINGERDLQALYKIRGQIIEENRKKETELQDTLRLYGSNQISSEQYKWEQINTYSQEFYDKEKERQAKLIEETQATTESIISTWSPVAEAFGAALVTGEDGWVAFKKAALGAIASVIESFAKMWALEGAAALVPGLTFNPAAAVGWFAASAAAYVAAGVVRNLKDGGLIMPQPGGTIVRIAEAGIPEYAVPERKDYLTRLADRISENMNRPIVNNINPSLQMPNGMTLRIGDREFYGMLTDGSRNGRFVVDPKRGVAKR